MNVLVRSSHTAESDVFLLMNLSISLTHIARALHAEMYVSLSRDVWA